MEGIQTKMASCNSKKEIGRYSDMKRLISVGRLSLQ
jgi:hypothetical protein